ncbi:hypothetical protein QNM99_24690 [Pseudomonas sp. PCH446]
MSSIYPQPCRSPGAACAEPFMERAGDGFALGGFAWRHDDAGRTRPW